MVCVIIQLPPFLDPPHGTSIVHVAFQPARSALVVLSGMADAETPQEKQQQQPQSERAALEIEEAEQKADEYQGPFEVKSSRGENECRESSGSCHRYALTSFSRCLSLFLHPETWLRMWTNTTNPRKVSCTTAFDIVAWCFGPVNQLRSIYRTGVPTLCTPQFEDFKLCLKVKAKSAGDYDEGIEG